MVITGGIVAAGYDGGAVANEGTLTLINVTFTNNIAGNGGGAIHNNGTLNVSNCNFTNNTAIDDCGGAIHNNPGSKLNISDSSFTLNKGLRGGAIDGWRSDFVISNSNFENNTVHRSGANAGYGGAIYISDSNLSVSGSNFNYYTALFGGAIANMYMSDSGKDFNIEYNRFYNNSADLGNSIWLGTYGVTLSNAPPLGLDFNWWGINNPDFDLEINANSVSTTNPKPPGWRKPVDWVIMSFVNNTLLISGEEASFTVRLNQTQNVSGHINDLLNPEKLPESTVKFSWGDTADLIDGTVTVKHTIQNSSEILSATIDNQILYLPGISPRAGLSLSVTDKPNSVAVSQEFIIRYQLTNAGPDDAENASVNFIIPNGLDYVDDSAASGSSFSNNVLTWNIDPLGLTDEFIEIRLRAVSVGTHIVQSNVTSDTTLVSSVDLDTEINVSSSGNGQKGNGRTTGSAKIVESGGNENVSDNISENLPSNSTSNKPAVDNKSDPSDNLPDDGNTNTRRSVSPAVLGILLLVVFLILLAGSVYFLKMRKN